MVGEGLRGPRPRRGDRVRGGGPRVPQCLGDGAGGAAPSPLRRTSVASVLRGAAPGGGEGAGGGGGLGGWGRSVRECGLAVGGRGVGVGGRLGTAGEHVVAQARPGDGATADDGDGTGGGARRVGEPGAAGVLGVRRRRRHRGGFPHWWLRWLGVIHVLHPVLEVPQYSPSRILTRWKDGPGPALRGHAGKATRILTWYASHMPVSREQIEGVVKQ